MNYIQNRIEMGILMKIKSSIDEWKLSNIKSKLEDCFENLESSTALNYIGEFNSTDVMK